MDSHAVTEIQPRARVALDVDEHAAGCGPVTMVSQHLAHIEHEAQMALLVLGDAADQTAHEYVLAGELAQRCSECATDEQRGAEQANEGSKSIERRKPHWPRMATPNHP